WPAYYKMIKAPISMAIIKKHSHNFKLIKSTTEYAALWHRLFNNARRFNKEGTEVYIDADFLQGI
ncbi:hypothetical protein C8R43DRAFT_866948, partial [Mycena crocata]